VVDGDPANLKVTGPDDLVRAEAVVTQRSLGAGGCPPDNGGGSRQEP
jgi:hypothetical protein